MLQITIAMYARKIFVIHKYIVTECWFLLRSVFLFQHWWCLWKKRTIQAQVLSSCLSDRQVKPGSVSQSEVPNSGLPYLKETTALFGLLSFPLPRGFHQSPWPSQSVTWDLHFSLTLSWETSVKAGYLAPSAWGRGLFLSIWLPILSQLVLTAKSVLLSMSPCMS